MPAQRSGELTLLSMNAYVGQADAAAVARVVREREVDVHVVVEASPGSDHDAILVDLVW